MSHFLLGLSLVFLAKQGKGREAGMGRHLKDAQSCGSSEKKGEGGGRRGLCGRARRSVVVTRKGKEREREKEREQGRQSIC